MTPADAVETVFLDIEFIAPAGERPRPVCLVAMEQKSGRTSRKWIYNQHPKEPPFAAGPKVLTVAYFASAELGCYLALNWPPPALVVDLYAEFRVATNGLTLPHGRGLLGAMQWYGLDGIEASKKDYLRKRILAGGPYDSQDRRAILDYCESDVVALAQLFPRILKPTANLATALLRGAYMRAVAQAEYTGVPVDAPLYQQMAEHWPELQANIIRRVNETIPVFEDGHFRVALFESYLATEKLLDDWPLTVTGELALDEDTFRDAAGIHPQLEPLRQVRQMLGQMHRPDLSIGADGRNRCLLSPFSTKTGRNAPSTTKFIFGSPSYMRGLIRPEPGKALAYVDWAQQEFGIAAALSGDGAMQAAYGSGDPYLTFAKYAKAVPEDATKDSHPHERGLFKTTVLGVQYLIGANGLACKLGVTLNEGEDLLDHHHRIFSRFWRWSDAVSDYGQMHGELTAAFGWRLRISPDTTLRTIRNFPMQANGAEMLRLACIYIVDAGVSLLAPIHDAVLIESDELEITHAVSLTQAAMAKASETVLAGFVLQTEARIIHPPNRFDEKRGIAMWKWMLETLAGISNCEDAIYI